MEVDAIIGEPDWAEKSAFESRTIVEELDSKEPLLFEE
jgi:hypothetical protein